MDFSNWTERGALDSSQQSRERCADTFGATSFAPPAFCEHCHRRLACRLIAVRRAFDVAVVPARPHPGAALRPESVKEENAADDLAVFEHVEVVDSSRPTSFGIIAMRTLALEAAPRATETYFA